MELGLPDWDHHHYHHHHNHHHTTIIITTTQPSPSPPHHRGVYRGKWTQLASKLGSGGRELHPEGGRIPQIYGSYVIYVLVFARITSTIRCPHISDVRTSLNPYLDSCRFETKMRQKAPNPI